MHSAPGHRHQRQVKISDLRVRKYPHKFQPSPEFFKTRNYLTFQALVADVAHRKPGKLAGYHGSQVRGFVQGLEGGGLHAKIVSLGEKISRMPRKLLSFPELGRVYAKRSAERVIAENVVYFGKKKNEVPPEVAKRFSAFPTIDGCVDQTHVSIAGLAALGENAGIRLRPAFLRFSGHSFAVFELDNVLYALDANEHYNYKFKVPVLRALTIRDYERILPGGYMVGADAHDMNLTFRNFF